MRWPWKKRPLTWLQAIEVLKEIKYKPNVSLGWMSVDNDQFILSVSADVLNADDFSAQAAIRSQYIIKHESEDQILRDVMKAMIGLETHEAREFFRYRGHKVFDPHNRVPLDLINGVR